MSYRVGNRREVVIHVDTRRGTGLFHYEGHEEREGLENETLDPALKLRVCSRRSCLVPPEATLKFIWSPVFGLFIRFDSLLNSILRVLRALRGEFSLTSGLAS